MESDCEGSLLEDDQETLEVVVGKEEQIRAVLIAGSFSPYVRLLTLGYLVRSTNNYKHQMVDTKYHEM